MSSANGVDSKEPGSSAGSVDNALRVLLLFDRHDQLRVAEVARDLAIAKSTAHRLLAMLEHHRYVERGSGGSTYRLGQAFLETGLMRVSSFDLRRAARPHLEALRDQTGESCGLLVLDGPEAVLLDFVAARHPLRVVERVGDRAPAHLTAAGKAMLAGLTTDDLRTLYPADQLLTSTPSSLGTMKDLERELEAVRHAGVATNLEESGAGVAGIAAPVMDARGRSVAAVLVAVPESRLDDDLVASFGIAVRSTADRLSALVR